MEKEGRGGYFSRGQRGEFTLRKRVGNFHLSQQLLSMIVGLAIGKQAYKTDSL